MLFERLDDRLDHVPVRAVAAFHVDMRFCVGRPPLLARGARASALGSPLRSCGAGVAARRALGEDVDRRVEPDGDRALVEKLARARVDEGAAAGCDHSDLALDQPRDQPPLAVAEILLAIALEHSAGGIAGGILDRGVAVDEWQAEPLRQPPADRRLADAHQADEDHRPVETLAEIHHLTGLYSGFRSSAKALSSTPPSGGHAPD